MLCTWQNVARRHLVRRASTPSIVLLGDRTIVSLSRRLYTTAQLETHLSGAGHAPPYPFFSTSKAEPSLSDQPTPTSEYILPTNSHTLTLSPARRGRAAAHAIRLSIQQGNLTDAFHIVNSVYLTNAGSLDGNSAFSNNFSRTTSSAAYLHPLTKTLTKDISPRLSSHTLLHGLIRLGMSQKASQFAEQMMRAGIPVRCRTLEVLYTSLAHSAPPLPTTLSLGSAFGKNTANVPNLNTSMTRDPGTRFALGLLNLARQSRQRRSHNMFKTLMALCILNGEIILGSLLFGVLLRDWQAREMLTNIDTLPTQLSVYETPKPVRNRMKEICTFVDRTLASDREDEHSQMVYKESLQALANIAGMLDRQEIPFDNITPLLCSLYNCPRGKDMVWVPDKKHITQMRQVEAYSYFHDVLRRLIHTLPDSSRQRKTMLPPLDIASYNTLLYYTLRHRRSTHLAEKVLNHMATVRQEPLEPNTTTLNIIARSGTLMRDSKIVETVLERLGQSMTGTRAQEDPVSALLDIAEKNGDNYTLTSRIAHLIATGRPHVVVDAIPALLPGLTRSLYPSTRPDSSLSPELLEVAIPDSEYRLAGLRRAAELGPVVFTSILNALLKTGRTGLAEKVWEWAKQAETLSWTPVSGKDDIPTMRPWCLPVEAYTIMVRVYGAEARKSGNSVEADDKLIEVVGWGGQRRRLKSLRRRNTTDTRSELGRRLGLKVYRSMTAAAGRVRQRVVELHEQQHQGCHSDAVEGINPPYRIIIGKRQIEVPYPDARFFNAILEIVGRQPGMKRRCSQSKTNSNARLHSKAYHRRSLRAARHKFIWQGRMVRSEPDPALLEVVKDMLAHGFDVPLLYQNLLIGRLEDVLPEVGGRRKRDRRLFAFGRDTKESEEVGRTTLRVVNTRSLSALGKKKKKRQGAVKKRKTRLEIV